jgi:hypothetical protein
VFFQQESVPSSSGGDLANGLLRLGRRELYALEGQAKTGGLVRKFDEIDTKLGAYVVEECGAKGTL